MKTLVLISKSVLFTVQVISWMPNMDILGPVQPPDAVLSAKGGSTYPSFSMLLKKLVRRHYLVPTELFDVPKKNL